MKVNSILILLLGITLISCKVEPEEDPEKIFGPQSGNVYIFCGDDSIIAAHEATLVIPADVEEFNVDVLSYGLETIERTEGSESISVKNSKFTYPPDEKFYYNTADNPQYNLYRYRQPVTFLFSPLEDDSVDQVRATFRITIASNAVSYADITITKEIKRK